MNENIQTDKFQEEPGGRVRFNDNVIVIEYDTNERIYKKPSIMNKILKLLMRFLKNS
jgi:hypothetical protein